MRVMKPGFTLRDWKALPEGFPAQLFDGQLVREPAPTYGHQALVGRIYAHLIGLFEPARVVMSPTDVVIDDGNVLQPDVCVLRSVPALDSHDVRIPVLVFEVLSPSTERRDRTIKAAKYVAAGVQEVWLLDPRRKTVQIRDRAGSRAYRGDSEARSEVFPDLRLRPSTFLGG